MRGQRTAYYSLFDDELPQLPATERKGRNEQLLQRRNELLIHRHYYYIKIKRKQFGDTIGLLTTEFHLTERTILDIFQKSELLRELRKKNPSVSFFKERYPHLVW